MAEKQSYASMVFDHTKKKLEDIKNIPDPAARAELAKMRRGVGKAPGDDPRLWGMLFGGAEEKLIGHNEAPSRAERAVLTDADTAEKIPSPSYAEWAVYTALTLYALHQQGKDVKSENMNKEQTLGAAVAKLANCDNRKSYEAVLRRFNTMATASDIRELSWHLRGIIMLLRREAIPMDYPVLARELYHYQFIDRMASVRLKWGRDFYLESNKLKASAEAGKDETHEQTLIH